MAHPQNTIDSQNQDIAYHTLDPDGDVVLILNSKDAIISGDDIVNLVSAETWNINHQDYEDDEQESEKSQKSDSSPSEPQGEDVNMDLLTSDDSVQQAEGQAEHMYFCGTGDIEVRVSSRHLALVSPVFRTLLSGNYSEGKALHDKGNVKIALADDPIGGMLILLKTLHLDFEQEKMTPSLLMQVAVLADKYHMAAKLLFWSRLWRAEIKSHIPVRWNTNVISYIGMFSMLKIDDRKDDMINLARGQVTDITSELGLPIHHIIKKLNEDRVAALDIAFKRIDEIVDRYWSSQSNQIICRDGKSSCDAAMLGFLLVGLKNNGLWPLPSSPFDGLTIAKVISGLKNIDLTSECKRGKGTTYYHCDDHGYRDCICEGFTQVTENLRKAVRGQRTSPTDVTDLC